MGAENPRLELESMGVEVQRVWIGLEEKAVEYEWASPASLPTRLAQCWHHLTSLPFSHMMSLVVRFSLLQIRIEPQKHPFIEEPSLEKPIFWGFHREIGGGWT